MSAGQEQFDELRMTEVEADFETLEDIRANMGNFAVFAEMIQRGVDDEV